jgi:glucose/arabinose dehydrogenase
MLSIMGLVGCTSPQAQVRETPTSVQISSEAQQAQTNQTAQPASCKLVEDGFGPQGQVSVRVEEVVTGLDVPWGIAFYQTAICLFLNDRDGCG